MNGTVSETANPSVLFVRTLCGKHEIDQFFLSESKAKRQCTNTMDYSVSLCLTVEQTDDKCVPSKTLSRMSHSVTLCLSCSWYQRQLKVLYTCSIFIAFHSTAKNVKSSLLPD